MKTNSKVQEKLKYEKKEEEEEEEYDEEEEEEEDDDEDIPENSGVSNIIKGKEKEKKLDNLLKTSKLIEEKNKVKIESNNTNIKPYINNKKENLNENNNIKDNINKNNNNMTHLHINEYQTKNHINTKTKLIEQNQNQLQQKNDKTINLLEQKENTNKNEINNINKSTKS